MNKGIYWILGIVIVILGIWYFSMRSVGPQEVPTATTTATTLGVGSVPSTSRTSGISGSGASPVGVTQTIGQGSINSLMAMNENLICSVVSTSSSSQRSGTVYIADGKMRGDFISTTKGVTTVLSMIDDGTSLYVWRNTGNTIGLKLPTSISASGSVAASHGALDPTTSLHYDCHPWNADANFFTPPANVTFSATAQ